MDNREWFRSARFGMMIHWGLYALLAGEYRGEQMGGADSTNDSDLGEWAMTFFRIPIAEYENLAKAFNPVYFDADEWVRLAKEAGMGYIVVTSKHHEGFALFKSDADAYNVVDATPFRRDVIGELAQACRKYGVKLGLYYSQELDWHEPDGGGYTRGYKMPNRSSWTNNWDFPENEKKDFRRCFERKIKPQVREILSRYGDICLIWFDTPGVITPEQSRELYDLVKEYQPDCLVNSRIGNDMGDYVSLGDNQVPSGKKDARMLYETAATLNDTWGYKAYDQNWKNPSEVVSLLTRLASRNVNYLLNVGPDGLGRIPAGAQDVLKRVGEWMRINGEMIRDAEPSPYGVELPGIAVTRKGDALYFALNDHSSQVRLPGLMKAVQKAELLGTGEVPFEQTGETLTVRLPENVPSLCPVLKLTAEGGIPVRPGILEMPDGSFTLSPLTAELSGSFRVSRASDMEDWKSTRDEMIWRVNAADGGLYEARITVNGLHRILPTHALVTLEANGEAHTLRLNHDHDPDSLISRHHNGMISDAGTLSLRPGENVIRLRLAEPVEEDMFRFDNLRLVPTGLCGKL